MDIEKIHGAKSVATCKQQRQYPSNVMMGFCPGDSYVADATREGKRIVGTVG